MSTHLRLLRFFAGAGLVTGLVAGCTSGTSSSSSSPAPASSAPSTPVSSSSAPSSPTSAASPASPASAPASSPGTGVAGAGTPACATRGLAASAGLSQGAAGSVYQVIEFKNISGAPCTIFGYPGVALAGGSPVSQIGAAATRSNAASATLVTLAAGATGNALLRITQAANYPASECQPVPSSYLQIYPPNQTTPIYLAYKSTACASTKIPPILSIGVVQPGTGG